MRCFHTVGLVAFLAALGTVWAGKVVEPADGHVMLGAWLDCSNVGKDSPAKANARVGSNFASFQFAQQIPLPTYNITANTGGPLNFSKIEASGTDASLFMTVYPNSFAAVTTADLTALGQQILFYQSPPYNRAVMLRYAPEMNGNWFPYGMQPAQYVAQWVQMHTIVSSIAPNTTFVWAPNSAIGYPFSYSNQQPLPGTTQADLTALDTNHDGQVNGEDDAYSPYYPGDQYVDWIGQSLYWKGQIYPYQYNEVADPYTFIRSMNGFAPGDATQQTPFYPRYCQNKPCMLSESGAAFHVNTTNGPGVGQAAIQQSWLNLFWGSNPVTTAFPRIKMIQMFEQQKVEDLEDLRDFRLTNASAVLSEFTAAIQPFISSGQIIQANAAPVLYYNLSASTTMPAPTASATGAAVATSVAMLSASGVNSVVPQIAVIKSAASSNWSILVVAQTLVVSIFAYALVGSLL